MTLKSRRIDISDMPEVLGIVEEVESSHEPRILRRGDEDVAIVLPFRPVSRRGRRRAKTEADYESFRAAAGSWKDVDTDKLIADIYESRKGSSKPSVEL